MNQNENQVNAMYVAQTGAFTDAGTITTTAGSTNAIWSFTPWGYWQDYYYPQVIRESYPVYVRERAEDKGKQAFEIIKMLQDKKFIKFEKVSEFIDAMDSLIKVL